MPALAALSRAKAPSLEEMLLADARNRAVNRALAQLNEELRLVIHLVYFEQLRPEEAAKVLKKSRKQIYNLLYRGKTVQMKVEVEPEQTIPVSGITKLGSEDEDLFDVLKELRASLAKEAGIPAYVVFSNATLTEMAKKKPRTMLEFRKITGVGEIKAAWYGKTFVERIRNYIENNGD